MYAKIDMTAAQRSLAHRFHHFSSAIFSMECFGVKCGKAHVAAHGTDTIRTQCPLASGERLQGSVVSYSRAGVREYNQTVIHRHSHAEIRFVDFHVITWLRHTRTYMNLRVSKLKLIPSRKHCFIKVIAIIDA